MKLIFSTLLIIALIIGTAYTYLYTKIPPAGSDLPSDVTADLVIIDKSDHTLALLKGDVTLKTYHVSLGTGGPEPKQREGDKKTPEGRYSIDRRNKHSSFYRSLHISYPDKQDLERAARENVAAGSDIMIHGLRNGTGFVGRFHLLIDWTQGCIAVTNTEMDEIWRAVPDGTPVVIKP